MVIAAAFIQLRITTIFIHFIALHHERRNEKSDPRNQQFVPVYRW